MRMQRRRFSEAVDVRRFPHGQIVVELDDDPLGTGRFAAEHTSDNVGGGYDDLARSTSRRQRNPGRPSRHDGDRTGGDCRLSITTASHRSTRSA
jgi:hypothetical protein